MVTFFQLVSALPPPPGQTSNFDNPESLAKWNVVCVAVCLSITTTLFALRTYARMVIIKERLLEDCNSYSPHYRLFATADTSQTCAAQPG